MEEEKNINVDKLLEFLEPSSREDLKHVTLSNIVGLTGNTDGIRFLTEELGNKSDFFSKLLNLMRDKSKFVAEASSLTLINLSSEPEVARRLLFSPGIRIAGRLWEEISSNSAVADQCCMILSNLTIDTISCREVLRSLDAAGVTVHEIIEIFCRENEEEASQQLHYLGPVLSNLSQLSEMRKRILDRERCVIQRLLPFTEYRKSKIRRGGIVGTLRNCCFEIGDHVWLLSDEVDILPRLLLPLAGPTPEGVDPEEIELLPIDLQYLDDYKTIEEDPDIRKMLLEALTKLCATRQGRESLRLKNSYFILRELHKVERDRDVKLACENLVDILIKKEEEIKIDNYEKIEIPKEIIPDLIKMDEEYLKN